jgi:hypothetical protein
MAHADYSMVFNCVKQARLASAAKNEECDDMTPDINSASKINGRGVKKKLALRQNNNVGKVEPLPLLPRARTKNIAGHEAA